MADRILKLSHEQYLLSFVKVCFKMVILSGSHCYGLNHDICLRSDIYSVTSLLLRALYMRNQRPNFWNFRLGQNSCIILSRYILGGRGIEGAVCENNANRFLPRMANLPIFIHNGGV